MTLNAPKWVTDVALVGLIFAAGVHVNKLNNRLEGIEELLNENGKKTVQLETAISIHHGNDWSEKVESKAIKRVDEIEKTIGDIGIKFNSATTNITDIKHCMKALTAWTKQGDVLIKRNRLDQFRALAVYTDQSTNDHKNVFINLQHDKGNNFKKGDTILLTNPLPPGRKVEVLVEGYIDDPKSTNVLVQINKKLLKDLGFTTKDGFYELFVQNKPESLRWKTLEQLIALSKSGQL